MLLKEPALWLLPVRVHLESPSQNHHTPSLLPIPGSTSSAAKVPACPLATLHVPLCFHWPPLHTCAPNHCLWLSLQTPPAPGCLCTITTIPSRAHTLGHQLQLACVPLPSELQRVTSCLPSNWGLALAQANQWTSLLSSGLQLLFSPARSELQPEEGLPFQVCHSLGTLPQPYVIIQKDKLLSYIYFHHSLIILHVY